jgi:hypothetical protein
MFRALASHVQSIVMSTDIEVDKRHGLRIDVVGCCSGVPEQRGRVIVTRDPGTVEIRHKAVVVADFQRQRAEVRRIVLENKRDADIAGCVLAVHLGLDIDVDVALVAAAAFVANTPAARSPG